MIMATSTPVNNSSAKLGFFRKHWWKIGVSLLFITALVFLGYNKYLDRQNVTDIKQLLSDFEKLKTDVESETGEKLYIEATCGNVGKFATSYACRITLPVAGGEASREYIQLITLYKSSAPKYSNCEILVNGKGNFRNVLRCDINIRSANSNDAEQVFYKYDTSPGSAV